MGYTHYWHRPETLDAQTFTKWTEDVRNIISNLPDPSIIKSGDGTGTPEISDSLVSFNGDARLDLDHETLYIAATMDKEDMRFTDDETGWYFAFCKTANKPYDLVVCAALIRLAYHFPEGVKITSDGDNDDWEPARELCESLFGFAVVPLRSRTTA